MSRGKPSKILELLVICAVVMALRALGVADPLAEIDGSIVDSRAVAITAATVRVSCGTTNLFSRVDGSGHFHIAGVPAGTCTVTAAATGYASRSTSVTVKAGSTATVSIALAAAPTPKPIVSKPPPVKEEMKRADRKVAPSTTVPASPSPMAIEDDPAHNTEGYSRIDDNPFKRTSSDPLSTFSADVDTASYSNMRRFLRQGQLPPKDAVRIEELINYFHYDYPAPQKADPFSITTEVGASPWSSKLQLVRIGLKAPAIDDAQVPARNLVFLLDVSGSMTSANKLPLLKQSMGLLVEQLRPQDKISIVVYAGASGTALAPTSGDRKDVIRQALFALEAGGSTNGAAGIQLAYDLAEKTLIKGGINRVILCTDGDFNVGTTSEGDLTRLIEKERERGVFLTVLGFGMGNLKDSTMEKLADRGNGNYAYIDSLEEARKVLVKEAGATLVTVAKDVKLQVEFNPATVAGYRLIGYENRLLRNEDFNDDKKDAGDIGAGHSVTALYEIVPAGVEVPQSGKVDPLKYQTKPATTTGAVASGELLTVKVRYKAPDGKTSKLLSRAVKKTEEQSASSVDMRWATAMAGFGMMLRDSPFRGQLTWKQVETLARGAVGNDAEGYRAEAIKLIEIASKLPASKP